MWRDVIDLGNWVESIVHGEPIRTVVWTEVFANKKSIRQSEFYSAANIGLKPELMFEIRSIEFQNHEKVKYKNVEYSITRVYDKGETTELIVSAAIGNG